MQLSIAFLAASFARTAGNPTRLYLGANRGVYGPLVVGSFAVRLPGHKPGQENIGVYSAQGEKIEDWPIGWRSSVLGVSMGSVVSVPGGYAETSPANKEFSLHLPSTPVAVRGNLQLFRNENGRFLALGSFGRRKFAWALERGTAISLLEGPPTVGLLNPSRPQELWVRDLLKNRSRLVRLKSAPATRTQFPEICLADPRTAYFMSESPPKEGVASVPLLREREKAGDETYHVRYLMVADLVNGDTKPVAKVETAGVASTGLVSVGLSPKFPGPDLVVSGATLLVRANSALFFVDRRVDPVTRSRSRSQNVRFRPSQRKVVLAFPAPRRPGCMWFKNIPTTSCMPLNGGLSSFAVERTPLVSLQAE